MKRLSLEELSLQAERFDAAVMASGDIDVFCSSTDWILPASEGLMPGREPWIFEDDGCYWALMRCQHSGGFHYLEPLEAMWGLSCPVVGRDIELLVAGIETLLEMPVVEWKLMVLAGLPVGHPLLAAVVSRLGDRVRLALGESSARLVAKLGDGMSAYLARRSKGLRRSLRRATAKAASAGISFEDASQASASVNYERIVAVEKRGWKGQGSVGIVSGDMHEFYKLMLPRLAARCAQEVRFASLGGKDVAYIMGGLRGSTYRGLQFSYDADYSEYALGNLLQLEQMTHCESRGIHHYDLGMSMDYKQRWADRSHETIALYLIRE
ncbi:MAG: GNAT family N-acetyltransferase [Myxococcales bacterium]|nr:GNAT family N-acetyltransferase [Myxococcales bacterium]